MRISIFVAVVLSILICGYYVGSPYLAAAELRDAMANKDGEALSELTDFPAVRQSMKEQMSLAMMAKMKEEEGGSPFALLGAGIAASMLDGMIQGIVSPAGLAKIMEGKNRDPIQFDNAKLVYNDMDKFMIQLEKDGDPLTVVLRRGGFASWKVTEIRLPLESIMAQN